MASITTWNRLEVSPLAPSMNGALPARVRDPLRLLGVQWQLGEFEGADAGSPAYVRLAISSQDFAAWAPAEKPLQPLPSGPIEPATEREPFSSGDIAITVEVGQTFERLLATAKVPDLVSAFRIAYAFVAPSPAPSDSETVAFLLVCANRAIDGLQLYGEAKSSTTAVLKKVSVSSAEQAGATLALEQLITWVEGTIGAPGSTDPSAWTPRQLEYAIDVALGSGSDRAELSAHPDAEGELDWYAFDAKAVSSRPTGVPLPPQRTLLPAPLRLKGMPNARFWDFDNHLVDYAGLQPDKRDLAKLMLLDFMLTVGNDWYVVPVAQNLGTALRVERLLLHDVFGIDTLLPNDSASTGPLAWTMFSTSVEGSPGRTSGTFLLPPSAAPVVQIGPSIEDVRFLRDEVADMVWAVEHAIESPLGRPLVCAEAAAMRAPAASAPSSASGLAYRIQSTVPANWIAFLPVARPDAAAAPGAPVVLLELAEMRGPDGSLVPPGGRVLVPTPPVSPYRVREEEVPREGTRIRRTVYRCRWIDGSTHLWIARRRSIGRGEGTSGLWFDRAVTP
jgi:hypothetical protein